MNEKNQTLEGFQIHDVVVLNKAQRTGEDGKKLGYSFYAKGEIGIVTELSDENMVLMYPDQSEENYVPAEIDKEYYYTISKASEIEYQNRIDKKIATLVEEKNVREEKIKELLQWRYDFEHSISFIGKLGRFYKAIFKVIWTTKQQ